MEHRRFSPPKLRALSILLLTFVAFVTACAEAPPGEERASRSSRFQGSECEDNNDPACRQLLDPPFDPDPFPKEPPNDPCINDPACMKNPCEERPFSPECAPSDPNPDPPFPPLDPLPDPLPERPCERFAGGCRD